MDSLCMLTDFEDFNVHGTNDCFSAVRSGINSTARPPDPCLSTRLNGSGNIECHESF